MGFRSGRWLFFGFDKGDITPSWLKALALVDGGVDGLSNCLQHTVVVLAIAAITECGRIAVKDVLQGSSFLVQGTC